MLVILAESWNSDGIVDGIVDVSLWIKDDLGIFRIIGSKLWIILHINI